MLTSILIALAGLLVYVSRNTKEGFWMTPSRQWKVEKVFQDPSTQDFFSVPNFQSILSPRFSNVDYGPNLRTEFPNYTRMGVPYDPLAEGVMPPDPQNYSIRENYNEGKSCGVNTAYGAPGVIPYQSAMVDVSNPGYTQRPIVTSGCQLTKTIGGPAIPLDPHNPYSGSYANGNYAQVLGDVVDAGAVNGWPTSTVAELDTASFMDQDGQMKQPIIYDRYIYANRNSRLRGQGDPIRGDLPIAPISGNWFIPSGAYEGPNVVLQAGAMNVMGGINNETSNALANLIYNTSGGAETAIGGVDMARTNMSHQVYGAASAALGDVQMSAFP